jgi:hypothetical protein
VQHTENQMVEIVVSRPETTFLFDLHNPRSVRVRIRRPKLEAHQDVREGDGDDNVRHRRCTQSDRRGRSECGELSVVWP